MIWLMLKCSPRAGQLGLMAEDRQQNHRLSVRDQAKPPWDEYFRP